jgi:hypothetical protein
MRVPISSMDQSINEFIAEWTIRRWGLVGGISHWECDFEVYILYTGPFLSLLCAHHETQYHFPMMFLPVTGLKATEPDNYERIKQNEYFLLKLFFQVFLTVMGK